MIGKRVISSVLSAAMLASIIPTAFAEDGAAYDGLKDELLSYSEQYPGGGIAFYEGKLEAKENEGSVYIDVVRYGSFDGEADVQFKAIDVSAAYGKDYTLSVDEGWFVTRELSPDADAGLLSDMYAGADADAVIGEEQEEPEADNEESVRLMVDEDAGVADISGGGTVAKEPQQSTGLRAARKLLLGEESDRASWQEITGANDPAVAAAAQSENEYNEYLSEFGEDVPGTEYTLHFDDGEYLKRIKVNLIDDGVSETDEQAMFMLYSAVGAELAKPETAYLNIVDTDENEPVVFAIEQDSVTVTPEEGYAAVTVKRTSGIEKFASVTVGTGAIDAVADVDYKSGSVEVIFPQGVTERTVQVPIYNAMRSEAKSFAVSIDTESAFYDKDRYAALVTILPDYSEKSMELYAAAFEGTEKEGASFDIYLPPAEGGALRTAATENFTSEIKNTRIKSSGATDTSWGSDTTVLSGLDLRNAEKITVEYTGKGYYRKDESYKDGCDTKTRTVTMTDRSIMFNVGGASVTRDTSGDPSATGTVEITNFSKSKNQSLTAKVRKTQGSTYSGDWVCYDISKVTIEYKDIKLFIDNFEYDTNTYTEKIYKAGSVSSDQKLGYSNGNKMKLGNGLANGGASATASRYSSAVNLTVQNVEGQQNSQGIAPKLGTNVYLAGWQYYKPNGNVYSTDIIKPDDMTLETLYSKLGVQNDYQIRPVFKPYPSMIRFNNSNAGKLEYTNNINNGKEIGVRMLDTIRLEAIPSHGTGYAVDTFLIKGYFDGAAHMSVGSKRAEAVDELIGKAYDTEAESKVENSNKRRTEYLDLHKNANNKVSTQYNEADSNKIVIYPNCEAVYIDMSYTTPKIDVKFNPSKATPQTYKDMGSVFFVDTDTQTAVYGDWTKPMTIQPVQYGKEYRVNAAYEDVNNAELSAAEESGEVKTVSDYKTTWQDFTGDVNGDGELSPAEVAALSKYGLDRSAFTGDIMGYFPKVTNSLLYYYFTKREPVQGQGGVYGIVALKDYPIFGTRKETVTPINGATVSVDDKTMVTAYNERFGGLKGTGGDGYFEVYDNTFVAGEAHRISVVYGPLSLAAVHNINVAQTYILDAYDTISVESASRTRDGKAMKTTDPMLNDDKEYVLTFATTSSISAKTAQKATLTFYRPKTKTIITSKEYASTGTNTGVFNCSFNPHSLNIPPGATVSVKFTDNDGVTYFEHDTGLFFQQSLGALSLLTSFSGKAAPAFEVLGAISSAFGFGWDGNLDDDSGKIGEDTGKYSIETTTEKKVLNVNLKFSKKGKIPDKDKDKDKDKEEKKEEEKDKDNPDGLSEEDLKAIAKDDNASKEKREDAAKKVDEKTKKSENKITSSYKLQLTFGLTLTLTAAKDPEHKGEWVFDSFVFVANASGELKFSTKFITPIGVPITITAKIGADATAILTVESRLGREYYMANLMNGETGSVDVINSGAKLDDYMYVYGKFSIYPYIELSAKVGWDGFSAELGGRMTLGLDYNGKTDVFSGSIRFDCWLKIEILIFSKKWTLASTGDISLFSNPAELYESLDEFNVSDRKNLKYRSGWNSGGGLSLAAVSELTETDLMDGVDPNADIKLMPLSGGRYLAVYADDVVNRDESNSHAVFYTVYSDGAWSEPRIIEDDGTVDDTPAIEEAGDGRLFVAWSSANEVFGSDPGVIESLNQMNIHGIFFDKETGAPMGDIIEVTKNTSEDTTRDRDPNIAYDSESNRLIIYYTKEEYKATLTAQDEGNEDNAAGVFGDLAYPYSLTAYRLYDLNTDEFVDYTDDELNDIFGNNPTNEDVADLKANYYGQRFVDLAPRVMLDRRVDDDGFLLGETTTSAYSGTNDPLVIESDAIGYNHLALYAYVLDYDGKKNTTYDRDVFMQIYNFREDRITYPILLTENNTAEDTDPQTQPDSASGLQFERIGGKDGITYLAYLADGKVKLINISENISNNEVLKEGDYNGVKYYYLDKTRAAGYRPEITVITPEKQGDYTGEMKLDSFGIDSNDSYVYFMFTQSGTKPKAGIEEGTSEAAKPENRVAETHIYMKRYDIENEIMTNPVRVTETEGMNYTNIAFAAEADGFKALATRCGTRIETVGEASTVVPDTDRSTLTAIAFKPDAHVELKNAKIDNVASGENAYASFDVYNGGIETAEGLTVEVTDGSGKAVQVRFDSAPDPHGVIPVSHDESSGTIALIGGGTETVSFKLPIAEDGNSAEFTATVKDSDGNELDRLTLNKTVERKLDVTSFNAELNERGNLTINAILTNNEPVISGNETFRIETSDGTVIYKKELEPLKPGEDVTVSDEAEIDYSKLFKTEKAEDGSVSAELELTATAGDGELKSTVSLYATSEQMARFKAIRSVEFTSGKNISLEEGKTLDISPKIRAGEYVGGRIDDNNETDIEAQGIEVLYESSNEDVVKVYDNGYIAAAAPGKAKIYARVIPADVRYDGEAYVARYATLPDEAIKTYVIDVNVGTGGKESGGGGSGSHTGAPIAKTTEAVNSAAPVAAYNSGKAWFNDVPEAAWFYSAIKAIFEKGLMNGITDEEFEPEKDITRAMFAVILYRMAGEPETDAVNTFNDVAAGSYYEKAVAWAQANGIITGYDENTFAPDDNITREQMAALMWRYAQFSGMDVSAEAQLDFTDAASVSEYALKAIGWLCAAGVIGGYDDGTVRPQANATRAETAAITERFISLGGAQ